MYNRVDIVFDRYGPHSVKTHTRQKRSGTCIPIRRVIDNRNVPLLQNSENFMTLHFFVQNNLVQESQTHLEVVVSSDILDEKTAVSTCAATNISNLQASHEEADTRMILHAVNSPADMVVVMSRDTDVFLLLHHYDLMKCNQLFLMV